MYTLQSDSHNNLIICKGDTVRSGYKIVNYGTYNAMIAAKALLANPSLKAYTNADNA